MQTLISQRVKWVPLSQFCFSTSKIDLQEGRLSAKSEKLRSYLEGPGSIESKKWLVGDIYPSPYQGQAENIANFFLGHQSEA